MNDDDLDSWLGGASATDQQREQLREAYEVASRFDDGGDGAEAAFSTIAQLILGDETIEGLVEQMQAAERRAAEARSALYAAVAWGIDQGQSENALARITGLSRTTVRIIVGK